MTDGGVTWVRTQPSADGSTYVVTIDFSEDRSVTLTPDGSLRYASVVLNAVARAEYDAAVLKQLQRLVPESSVAQVVRDLRKDRPDLDAKATYPFSLEPGVNIRGEGFLTCSIDGTPVGQWSPADARGHALAVIEAVTVADLDSGYYRELKGVIGLDENRARNVIDDLRKYREDFDE